MLTAEREVSTSAVALSATSFRCLSGLVFACSTALLVTFIFSITSFRRRISWVYEHHFPRREHSPLDIKGKCWWNLLLACQACSWPLCCSVLWLRSWRYVGHLDPPTSLHCPRASGEALAIGFRETPLSEVRTLGRTSASGTKRTNSIFRCDIGN